MKTHFLKIYSIVFAAFLFSACGEDEAVTTIIPPDFNPVPKNTIALRVGNNAWGSNVKELSPTTNFRKVITTELGTNAWLLSDSLFIKGLNVVNGDTQTLYLGFKVNPNALERNYNLRFDRGSVSNGVASVAFYGWRREFARYVPSISFVSANVSITDYNDTTRTLTGSFNLQQQLGEDPITVVTNGLLQEVRVIKQ